MRVNQRSNNCLSSCCLLSVVSNVQKHECIVTKRLKLESICGYCLNVWLGKVGEKKIEEIPLIAELILQRNAFRLRRAVSQNRREEAEVIISHIVIQAFDWKKDQQP